MPNKNNPFSGLKSVFHEPNRLAIVSVLSSQPNGISFSELKETCELTDGNLSRHLKTLEEADVVIIEKREVRGKSRTIITLSDSGRDAFIEYLQTLEEVLRKAANSFAVEEKPSFLSIFRLKPAGA